MLLLKPQDFKSRVQEFVKEVCNMKMFTLAMLVELFNIES
jgi:hypothetical protein